MKNIQPSGWVTALCIAVAITIFSYTLVVVIADIMDALTTVLPPQRNTSMIESAATHDAIRDCINREGLLRAYYDEYTDTYTFTCENKGTGSNIKVEG